MSEFEAQHLLILSRWEFDLPTLFFIAVSMGFMALGFLRACALDAVVVRLSQVAYAAVTAYLYVRTYAAIVRAQKLGAIVVGMEPSFEFWNPALQQPTWYIRNGLFVVLILVTLFVLHRSIRDRA